MLNEIHPTGTTAEGLYPQRTTPSIEVKGLPDLADHGLQDGEYGPSNQSGRGTQIGLRRVELRSLHTARNNTHFKLKITAKLSLQSNTLGQGPFALQIKADAMAI